MRLINIKTLGLDEFVGVDVPPYAILSHRWRKEEVTFKDVELGRHKSMHGYWKMRNCCVLAGNRGFGYVWIDTCCIDKSSSAELSEAINSMFRWYEAAAECYAYLDDIDATCLTTEVNNEVLGSSEWFTRGWTLQELIAPKEVYFFDRDWVELGRKSQIAPTLAKSTGIDVKVLKRKRSLGQCSIAQRMSWAALRGTTRVEDEAYSLLGLFGVNIPLLYGEGTKAFQRLQEEIMRQSADQSILTWTYEDNTKSFLAPAPSHFQGLQDVYKDEPGYYDDLTWTFTNTGLSLKASLIPWSMNVYVMPLRCSSITAENRVRRERNANLSNATGVSKHLLWHLSGDQCYIFVQQAESFGHYYRVLPEDHGCLSEEKVRKLLDKDVMRAPPEQRQICLRWNALSAEGATSHVKLHHGLLVESSSDIFGGKPLPDPSEMVSDQTPIYRDLSSSLTLNMKTPSMRTTAVFRCASLRGQMAQGSKAMIFIAFDFDWTPVLLITSKIPGGPRLADLWEGDLSKLPEGEKHNLLYRAWVLKEIELGKDAENIVAFRYPLREEVANSRGYTVRDPTGGIFFHFRFRLLDVERTDKSWTKCWVLQLSSHGWKT